MNSCDAIYPKEKLISRSAKRLYNQESAKAIEDFEQINTEFLIILFEDGTDWKVPPIFRYTYKELYNIYLEKWIALYFWYKSFGRLQYCQIDEDWFVNNYKPLENEK